MQDGRCWCVRAMLLDAWMVMSQLILGVAGCTPFLLARVGTSVPALTTQQQREAPMEEPKDVRGSLQPPRSWGSSCSWGYVRHWIHVALRLHMCNTNRSGLVPLGACGIFIPGARSGIRMFLVVGLNAVGIVLGNGARGRGTDRWGN